MKVLFIGDVVGNLGRKIIKSKMGEMREKYNPDYCIANGENAAGGSGITNNVAEELFRSGIDVITLGNHTWSKRDIVNYIDTAHGLIRPANYGSHLPGRGSIVFEKPGKDPIGVLNLLGRVFMDPVDSPFTKAESEIKYLKDFTNIIIVDMHGEATSEKAAMAWYLDGRVSAVLGTHTHVQTADERILDRGTAFITDAGMTGPHEGILGVKRNIILKKFLEPMPVRFDLATGKGQFNGVILKICKESGKALSIGRLNELWEAGFHNK